MRYTNCVRDVCISCKLTPPTNVPPPPPPPPHQHIGLKGTPAQGVDTDTSNSTVVAASATPAGGGGSAGTGSAWLHGFMTKEHAEELVTAYPGTGDGTFLVWERKPQKFALTVVYLGKPTHHQVLQNKQGLWTVNKTPFLKQSHMVAMINGMSDAVPGWPVPLTQPVPFTSRDRQAAAVQNTAVVERPKWDCRHLGKEAALTTLKGQPGGSFVIRSTDKGYACISLVTPTLALYQRVISLTSTGAMALMDSELQFSGADEVGSLNMLIEHYSQQTHSELPCLLKVADEDRLLQQKRAAASNASDAATTEKAAGKKTAAGTQASAGSSAADGAVASSILDSIAYGNLPAMQTRSKRNTPAAGSSPPKLSRRESEKRNFDASKQLAEKEGRDMTREEQLGLGSASTEDTSRRLGEMTFNFSFGGT